MTIKPHGFGEHESVESSGPTYVAVRSAKHSSSTAYAHAVDFDRITQLPTFAPVLRTSSKEIKPVFITTVDGGPDENPRYTKTIDVAIHHFKKYDLDAFFLATNAPGRSAFNVVERRMAPLSRSLCGVILPHDKWGNHLDSQGNTIDPDLEKRNFKNAGEVLAEIWSEHDIDGHPVFAEYIDPEKSEISKSDLIEMSEEWKAKHVRSSQYFLQIVKCHNQDCCGAFRSRYGDLFPKRFLPPPMLVEYNPQVNITKTSISASNHSNHTRFATLFQNIALRDSWDVAYDSLCPSMKDKLAAKICPECNIYFATLTMLKNHRKLHSKKHRAAKTKPKKIFAKRDHELLVALNDDEVEWVDGDELDITDVPEFLQKQPVGMPVVLLEDYFQVIWENAK